MQHRSAARLLNNICRFEQEVYKERAISGHNGCRAKGQFGVYSKFDRDLVWKQYQSGMKQVELQRLHNCSSATIWKILKEQKEAKCTQSQASIN